MTATVPNVGLWSTWPTEPGNDHLVVPFNHKKAPTEVRAGAAVEESAQLKPLQVW